MTAYELNNWIHSVTEMSDWTIGFINAVSSLDKHTREQIQAACRQKTGSKNDIIDMLQQNYAHLANYKNLLEDLSRSTEINWPKI